jgi:cysteinyl-tRNA synthetase
MTDYFGYNVHFVMNITDIDDKVCLKIPDLPVHTLTPFERSSSEPVRITY